MEIAILSLVIGSFFTWLVAKGYYRKSKDDFALLLSKIDKITAHNQISDMRKNAKNRIDFKNLQFNDVISDTDNIGEAILAYVKTSGAAMGSPESGIPIFAIDELISRVDRIKNSLQGYRNWRVHLGA